LLSKPTKPNRGLARWILDYLPLLFWMGLIFFLSAQSQLVKFERPLSAILFFKTAHVVTYAILAFLWWRALSAKRAITWRVLLSAWLLTTLYGLTDEIHQSYVPGRTARFADVLFDASGALAMILMIRIIKRFIDDRWQIADDRHSGD